MSIGKRLWGSRGGSSQEEVIELTNQFYVTLRAYFSKVKSSGEVRNSEAFARIEELLAPGAVQNWANAYEIEQMLVHLFGDDVVAVELGVRVLEAQSILRPEAAAAYVARLHEIDGLGGATPDAAALALRSQQRRTVLARLVNDLQWRYIVNEATRRYSKLITKRTAVVSSSALVMFLAVVAWVILGLAARGDWRQLGVAVLAGLWGATFSLLTTLRTRLGVSTFDDLKLMKALPVLVSRALVGASAACILYFFLLSGLLGGEAFPKLMTEPFDLKNLALLVVWCFIAGFSEQLVPGLLAKTEARITSASTGGTDRFRPTTGTTPVPPASPKAATDGGDKPAGPAKPDDTQNKAADPEKNG